MSDGQASIKILQNEGVAQAQVQPAPERPTAYQVESPSSTVAAATTTCPWVRVQDDGTTLVRNYAGGAGLPSLPKPSRKSSIT